jgi:hypothetical protein
MPLLRDVFVTGYGLDVGYAYIFFTLTEIVMTRWAIIPHSDHGLNGGHISNPLCHINTSTL